MPEAAWQLDAACRHIDPDAFFTNRGEHPSPVALEACAHCPVSDPCLDHALRHETHGLWAGTSERERRRMRRALGIRVHKPRSYLGTVTEIRKERALCS